jgi:hypothetical protein
MISTIATGDVLTVSNTGQIILNATGGVSLYPFSGGSTASPLLVGTVDSQPLASSYGNRHLYINTRGTGSALSLTASGPAYLTGASASLTSTSGTVVLSGASGVTIASTGPIDIGGGAVSVSNGFADVKAYYCTAYLANWAIPGNATGTGDWGVPFTSSDGTAFAPSGGGFNVIAGGLYTLSWSLKIDSSTGADWVRNVYLVVDGVQHARQTFGPTTIEAFMTGTTSLVLTAGQLIELRVHTGVAETHFGSLIRLNAVRLGTV